MIFKVFYQDTILEVPVRERTKTLYMEADSEEKVRKSLADRNYNVEFVTPLSDKALAYDQNQNPDFEVEKA
ncbi:DNA-dependent RNA polymerase subunit epsilon [Salisediminibacterium selenitireducens]|uniref:DNA-directed RNA polymerase subunit epsilon n=1 Tax=Bacillus selenitireducens (strain ATCC 700615 / DSM 15326 / MLS10) TaxID=439292 RepID=D6XTH2_BACIE|nr:DNA-directed RNA polymerase subunit epsilon [Salisediminibacterium selenitireducens]ADH99108.1 protein of unknown function DUF1447 [[Bacillus] selenitireducens MLS10]